MFQLPVLELASLLVEDVVLRVVRLGHAAVLAIAIVVTPVSVFRVHLRSLYIALTAKRDRGGRSQMTSAKFLGFLTPSPLDSI